MSYLDSCSGNIFRNGVVKEAKELLNTIAQNYQDWKVGHEEKVKLPPKKRGIIHLPEKDMKESTNSIEEKGIKSADLKLLGEKGIKLPIDEPCFPIKVHSILKGDGKTPRSIDVSYVDGFSDFNSHQALINKDCNNLKNLYLIYY
jgi:hypothetical protein